MIRPRQPISPWHVLPLCLMCPIVALAVDLGGVFEMPTTLALTVYGLQVLLAILVYFSVFIVNRIDLDWLYGARQRDTIISKRWLLAYFIFLARTWLLCAMEADSLITLAVSRHLLPARSDKTKVALVGLLLFFAAIHTVLEARRLGEAAWEIRERGTALPKRRGRTPNS